MNLTPGMTLHLKNNPELCKLEALLAKVYTPIPEPTLEMVTIQRNALLQIIIDMLTITQPAEVDKYQHLFFNIHTIFPEKDYSPYSTGNNLEKNIFLNIALFDLGCSLYNPCGLPNVSSHLLKYFSIHTHRLSIKTPREQLQIAYDEEIIYQKHKDILPTEILDTARSFTEARVRCYTRKNLYANMCT